MAIQFTHEFRGVTVANGYLRVDACSVQNRKDARGDRYIHITLGFYADADAGADPANALDVIYRRFVYSSPDNATDILAYAYTKLAVEFPGDMV